MNKSFKGEVRSFFEKQLKDKRKEPLIAIAEGMGIIDTTGCKMDIIERIATIIFDHVDQLKNDGRTSEDGIAAIENFFKEKDLKLMDKYKEQIYVIIAAFFRGEEIPVQRNTRVLTDPISNIWSEDNKNYECVCDKTKAPNYLQNPQIEESCYNCGKICHIKCFWNKQPDKLYECPTCFLKNCLPSKQVKTVLFAGYLKYSKKQKNQHKICFPTTVESRKQKNVSFEVRCVRLNDKNRFEMTFPQNCVVLLNKSQISDFKPLSSTSPLKRRNDEQLKLEKQKLQNYNELIIEEKHQYIQKLKASTDSHLIMVFAVVENKNLDQKFITNRMEREESKEILRSYLNKNNDSKNQVMIEGMKVSLKCQYFQTKIAIPVRSRHCTSHYQPFDLRNFLAISTNLKSSAVQKWKCPICKKRAYDLVVDDYLKNLIDTKIERHVSEMIFNRDGECKFIESSDSESEMQNSQLQILANKEIPSLSNKSECIINLQSKSESNKNIKFQEVIEIEESDEESLPKSTAVDYKRSYSQRKEQIPSGEEKIGQPRKKNKIDQIAQKIPIKDIKEVHPLQTNLLDFLHRKNTDHFKSDQKGSEHSLSNKSIINLSSNNLANHQIIHNDPRNRCYKEKIVEPMKMHFPRVNLNGKINSIMPLPLPACQKKNQQTGSNKSEIQKKSGLKSNTIEIESDDDSLQEREARRLRFHVEELQKEKKSLLLKPSNNSSITAGDEAIFNSICSRFLNIRLD